jgi:hypothetical protein
MCDSDDDDAPGDHPAWNPLWPPPGGASPPLKPRSKEKAAAEQREAAAAEAEAEAAAGVTVQSSVTLNEMRELWREADMDAEVRAPTLETASVEEGTHHSQYHMVMWAV